jgi:Zn-dependent peptidase ImmA (M78 family)
MEVLILNNIFKLLFKKGILDDNSDKTYGTINYEKFEIIIQTEYPYKKQRETVIHEILHGIDDTYKIGLKENQVCLLASGILKFYDDNIKLIKACIENESNNK